MKRYFEQASAQWVRYSDYEWKKDGKGILYLTPAAEARPIIYDPLADAESLVLDALNIGRMGMSRKPDTEIQKAIHDFAVKYGLFGLMTALPTTAKFMDYEAVYLLKNRFFKDETMNTLDYLALFFPFEKPELAKRGIESLWNLSGSKDMMALAMTMRDQPMAVNMSFRRSYAERYVWLKNQFKTVLIMRLDILHHDLEAGLIRAVGLLSRGIMFRLSVLIYLIPKAKQGCHRDDFLCILLFLACKDFRHFLNAYRLPWNRRIEQDTVCSDADKWLKILLIHQAVFRSQQ